MLRLLDQCLYIVKVGRRGGRGGRVENFGEIYGFLLERRGNQSLPIEYERGL